MPMNDPSPNINLDISASVNSSNNSSEWGKLKDPFILQEHKAAKFNFINSKSTVKKKTEFDYYKDFTESVKLQEDSLHDQIETYISLDELITRELNTLIKRVKTLRNLQEKI